tara:strand:- start:1991 stop:2938 length:948 start_codon:yes stop_codon:yes gene_type:complete
MFYGDNNRWFVATVKSNDPEKRGRYKIRIHGLHSSDVEDKHLPYAETMLPTTEGGVSGIGKIPQLQNGAFVFGIFLDGENSQAPLILGSITHLETPSTVQRDQIAATGNPRVLEDRDNNKRAIVDLQSLPVVNITDNLKDQYANGNSNVSIRRMIVMQQLINSGLSQVAAAGVTGNLESESSFNPTANYKNEIEDSWGLAQWNDNAGRLQPLKDYATAKNADWQDFFIQLEFLIVDMQTNDWVRHRVWPRLSNNKLTTRFEGVLDDFNATWNFFNNYEIAATEKYYSSGREKNAAKAFYQYQSSLQSTLNNLGIS